MDLTLSGNLPVSAMDLFLPAIGESLGANVGPNLSTAVTSTTSSVVGAIVSPTAGVSSLVAALSSTAPNAGLLSAPSTSALVSAGTIVSPVSSPMLIGPPASASLAAPSSATLLTTTPAVSVPLAGTPTWSSVVSSIPSGSCSVPPLPPHTFVFSSIPGTSPTTIDHGVSIRVPFRGVSNDDFLAAIALTVPPTQISDIPRVADTVQVYFRDASWARQLIASGLEIRTTLLDVLPVGVSPKRLILSDVPPEFPDNFVRSILSTYGQVRGPIVTLPAATTSSLFKHVRSFRRAANVVFATDADFQNLPSKVAVRYDSVDLTFFVNNPIRCFKCNALGHTAQRCTPSSATPTASGTTPSGGGSRRSRSRRPPRPPISQGAASSVSSALGASSAPSAVPVVTTFPVVVPPTLPSPAVVVAPPSTSPSCTSSAPPSGAEFAVDTALPVPEDVVMLADASADEDDLTCSVPFNPLKRKTDLVSPPAVLVMGPPSSAVSHAPKSRRGVPSKYFFDAASNRWSDSSGSFTPLFDLATVSHLAVNVLSLDNPSARSLLVATASSPDALVVLVRQLLVWVYTDPTIAALEAKPRSAKRQQLHNFRKYLRVSSGDLPGGGSSSDCSQ